MLDLACSSEDSCQVLVTALLWKPLDIDHALVHEALVDVSSLEGDAALQLGLIMRKFEHPGRFHCLL